MARRGEATGQARQGRHGGHPGTVAAVGGALTLLVVAGDLGGQFDGLERRSLDWRFGHAPRRAAPMHRDICFVDIDDGALAGRRWPWPREKLGLALGELGRAGARTLVLDLLLTEPEEPPADGSLARGDARVAAAVAAVPTVIAIDFGDGQSGGAGAPIPELAAAARAIGFVNFRSDDDGALRAVDVVERVEGGRRLQLGVAAALLHLGSAAEHVLAVDHVLRVGTTTLPLDEGRLWLDWPTTPADADAGDRAGAPAWLLAAPRCSLGVALDVAETERDLEAQSRQRDELAAAIARDFGIAGDGPARIDAVREETRFRLEDVGAAELTDAERRELEPFQRFEQFERALADGARSIAAARAQLAATLRGKLVFVGWTATGAASDFVPTPLGARTPGVVAHAVAADMVLSGRTLRFPPGRSSVLLALGFGLLATAACTLPLLGSLAAVLLLLGGQLIAALLLFGRSDFVLPLVAPMAAGGVAWIGATALQSALAQRDQRRITRQFKARVAPELVDFLVDHPAALSMQGEPRDVTAFFVDLAGFTSLSERLGAQATVALLNRCMRAMTEELTRHGAYVNKYLGDGLMAFWSAFRPDPDQAAHACQAALAVQAALARVDGAREVAARIGIATGRVIVGDCGAPPLLHDYTAIGDAINLAARLESANKQFGTKILVDGATRKQASDRAPADAPRFRPCGRVVVVGQTAAVDLYEVVTPGFPGEQIELTAQAIESFRGGRLAECADRFRVLERRFGPCQLATVYLDELTHPDPDFDGVLHLASK